MSLSTHYAMDVPRGVRIVSPVTYGAVILAPGVIADVAYQWGQGIVLLTFTDGEAVPVPNWLRLTVENDTPQRNARLLFANLVLAAADTDG